jgi:hypothetical protein
VRTPTVPFPGLHGADAETAEALELLARIARRQAAEAETVVIPPCARRTVPLPAVPGAAPRAQQGRGRAVLSAFRALTGEHG